MSPLGATLVTARSSVIFMPGRFIGIGLPMKFMFISMLMFISMRAFCAAGIA